MIHMKIYNKLVKNIWNKKQIILLSYSQISLSHFKFIYNSKVRKFNFLISRWLQLHPTPTHIEMKIALLSSNKKPKQIKRKNLQNNDSNNTKLKAHTNTQVNNNSSNNKNPIKQNKQNKNKIESSNY